eukprot:scaffold89039_cov21-Tisochrysis_lutea.AAC.4
MSLRPLSATSPVEDVLGPKPHRVAWPLTGDVALGLIERAPKLRLIGTDAKFVQQLLHPCDLVALTCQLLREADQEGECSSMRTGMPVPL